MRGLREDGLQATAPMGRTSKKRGHVQPTLLGLLRTDIQIAGVESIPERNLADWQDLEHHGLGGAHAAGTVVAFSIDVYGEPGTSFACSVPVNSEPMIDSDGGRLVPP